MAQVMRIKFGIKILNAQAQSRMFLNLFVQLLDNSINHTFVKFL